MERPGTGMKIDEHGAVSILETAIGAGMLLREEETNVRCTNLLCE